MAAPPLLETGTPYASSKGPVPRGASAASSPDLLERRVAKSRELANSSSLLEGELDKKSGRSICPGRVRERERFPGGVGTVTLAVVVLVEGAVRLFVRRLVLGAGMEVASVCSTFPLGVLVKVLGTTVWNASERCEVCGPRITEGG